MAIKLNIGHKISYVFLDIFMNKSINQTEADSESCLMLQGEERGRWTVL